MLKFGIDTAIMSCLALFATFVTLVITRRMRFRMSAEEIRDMMVVIAAAVSTFMVVTYVIMASVLDSLIGRTW